MLVPLPAEVKYWEEDRKYRKGEPYEENKYLKWKVENALEMLEKAQEILADSKMMGYVKKCLMVKQSEMQRVAKQLGVEQKIRAKMKETFSG